MSEKVDEIVGDLRNMFNRMNIPVLIVYNKDHTEGTTETLARYSAGIQELVPLVATAVTCLSARIVTDMGLPEKEALEMAIKAVQDCISTGTATKQVIDES